eukprot:m.487368 g.487368  ORF g.487368 m.487368 type:complete len:207 (+) comp24960_c0_seq1:369-989(+)
MKLKQLESYLGQVETFAEPKIHLEQYPTSAHIAARMVFEMHSRFDDLEGKLVADLGCGGGILGIGAAMLGAESVGVDVDQDALDICRDNVDEFEVAVDVVHGDVALGQLPFRRKTFDTVVMNPPFGTKRNEGIDVRFLQAAVELCTGAIYSLHKSSTRKHIAKKAEEWGFNFEVVAQLRYDIPAMYKFHKKQSVDIEVDFVRLSPR